MKPWPDIDAQGDGPREPWLDRGEASPPPSDPFSTPFEAQSSETPATFLRPPRRGARLILILFLCAASAVGGFLYHEILIGGSTTARPARGPTPTQTAAGSPVGNGTGAASASTIQAPEPAEPASDRSATGDDTPARTAPGPGQTAPPAPTASRADDAVASTPGTETPEPSTSGSGGRSPSGEAPPAPGGDASSEAAAAARPRADGTEEPATAPAPQPSAREVVSGLPIEVPERPPVGPADDRALAPAPVALVHRLARTVVDFSLEQSAPTVTPGGETEAVSLSSAPLPERVLDVVAGAQRAALAADRLASGEVDEAASLVEEAADRLGEARPTPWPLADRVAGATELVREIERALRADRCDTARRALSRLQELARVPEDHYARSLRACDRRASRPPLTLE